MMTTVIGAMVLGLFLGLFVGSCKLIATYKQGQTTRLTNLHYFDHNDRYFDFGTNQWHFKPGSHREGQ
jgi:hypothetical protein